MNLKQDYSNDNRALVGDWHLSYWSVLWFIGSVFFFTFCGFVQAAQQVVQSPSSSNSAQNTRPNIDIDKGSKRQFNIAIGQDSYPYQFETTSGAADGLMVDLWRLWARKNNYEVNFMPAQWSRSIELLDQQQVDFHAGLSILTERQKRYQMGRPLVAIHSGLFVHQKLSGIATLEDVRPYVIGVVDGAMHISALRKLLPDIHLKRYPTRDDLYRAALKGEVRVFVGLDRLSARHPQFNKISKLFPLYKKIDYQSFYLTYAVNRQLPEQGSEMALIISQGLEKVTAEEIKNIEKKWLGIGAEADTLVIALPIDRAPFMSVSANGEPIGLIVDIWKEWAKKTKREIAFLTDNSSISIANLANRKADIHAGFADVSINVDSFPHAHHIYSYQAYIYYPTDGAEARDEPNINNSNLGVLADTPVIKDIRERYVGTKLVPFTNYQQMISAATEGKIDAFVAGEQMVEVELIKHNLLSKFSRIENVSFENRMYALVRQDNQALISQIKEGFSLIDLEQLRALERSWIKSTDALHFANAKVKIALNASQKSWLMRHPVIRLGALKDWAPIEFVDDDGHLIGVTADLISIIEKRAQVFIEVKLFDEWNDIVSALQNREIDMVASMDKTAERESFANFTEEYWPQHWAVVTDYNQEPVSLLAQLKGKRLAVVKGYQLIPFIHQRFPQILLQVVPDHRSGFIAIRNGQADAFIDGMANVASEIRAGQYQDLRFSLVDDIPPAMERIGVRKDWQPLIGILNKVISTISDNEEKKILEKWFELKVQSGIDKRKATQAAVVVLTVFIVVIWWNRRLQREVKKRRIIERKMKYMATHDELTGLPNRVLLRDRLTASIAQHARHQEQLALLFIDLDGFKDVNDTYGHDVGDELLIQIAKRFKGAIRRSDTVARFGGDEFVVLLTGLHDKTQVEPICEKLLESIGDYFQLSSCRAKVGASIGVAMYPADGTDDTQLMKIADTLMYEVKASGKNNYVFSDK